MADTKITALTALTAADPANDVIPIVDVSDTSMAASGTTKKISVNNILGASGTATLASATITGALTANGGVSLANATAINFGGLLTIYSDTAAGLFIRGRTVSGTTFQTQDGTNPLLNISNAGVFTFSDGAGGTRMTLNSTGLGIGGSPTTKLDVLGSGDGELRLRAGSDAALIFSETAANKNWKIKPSAGTLSFQYSATAFNSGYANLMLVTETGNVGIGVTPSTSWVTYKALEFDTGIVSGSSSMALNRNCYFDGVNWRYKATTSFGISQYQLSGNGSHSWKIASSGSAGALINGTGAWTDSMTLDASGNLLITKTSVSGTTLGCELTATGVISGASANLDNLNIYNTTASAYRFYVSGAGTVFATNTVISAISDARLKDNVQDIDVGLAAILSLKPRKFDWKAGKGKDIKGDRGFIAQEFETVFPHLIDEWKDPAPEGEAPYKSVRADLIPVLVKAIQELTARVQTLEAR